jgi:DNA-binding HxlR family transcriptional regulator
VEYKLTRLGRSLSALMKEIEVWVTQNYPRIRDAARSFDAETRAT